jgi:hypothetical protein
LKHSKASLAMIFVLFGSGMTAAAEPAPAQRRQPFPCFSPSS